MKQLIYSLILIVTIGSCTKNEPFSNDGEKPFTATTPTECDPIHILPFNLIDYYTDPFELKEASIVENTLVLQVEYGGGCGEADFLLLVDNAFMESYPVQVNAMLSLRDNDPCKAIMTRELCFDLTELAELYQSSYQTPHGSISIRLHEHPSLLYTF